MLRQNLKKPIYELTDEEMEEYKKGDLGGLPEGSVTFPHYGYRMEEDEQGNKVLVPVAKSSDTGPVPQTKTIPGKVMKAGDSSTGEFSRVREYPYSGIEKTETAPLKFMDVLKNKYSNRVKRIKRR